LIGLGRIEKFAAALKESQVDIVLKRRGVEMEGLEKYLISQKGWIGNIVSNFKSWMYPNVNK
jgi:hypothetical protein